MFYDPLNPFGTRRLTKEELEKASKSLDDMFKNFNFDDMFKSFSKEDFAIKNLLIELITTIKEEKQDQLFDKLKNKESLKKFIKYYMTTDEDKWYEYYKDLYPSLTKEAVVKMINDKTLPKPDLSNYNVK